MWSPEAPGIETVVIPVAGAGSRLISMTSYLEKCLIPVDYGQPVVDYSVVDAIRGGVSRIIFITSERGKVQLNDKYGKKLHPDLVAQLRQVNKTDLIAQEENHRFTNHGIKVEYITQPAEGEYGTTVPLFLAETALKGEERFGLLMGDDFTYNQWCVSEFGSAAADLTAHPEADHLAMAASTSREAAVKYGVFFTDEQRILIDLREKPPLELIPDNPTFNISKYILKNNIWVAVHQTMEEEIPPEAKGERQFTRTMKLAQRAGQTFLIHPLSEGTVYLDGGTEQGLRDTSRHVREHPQVY